MLGRKMSNFGEPVVAKEMQRYDKDDTSIDVRFDFKMMWGWKEGRSNFPLLEPLASNMQRFKMADFKESGNKLAGTGCQAMGEPCGAVRLSFHFQHTLFIFPLLTYTYLAIWK